MDDNKKSDKLMSGSEDFHKAKATDDDGWDTCARTEYKQKVQSDN